MARKRNTKKKPSITAQRRVLSYKLKSISRTRQDIQSWNRALNLAQNADNPKNFALQLLYNEIMNDALLTSQTENRKQQVFSADIRLVQANGETDLEQTDKLKKHPVYRAINNSALDSIFYGYSLVELNLPGSRKPLTNIPRTNVVPQSGLFYEDYADDQKVTKYREIPEYGTWVLEFTNDTLGLLNKAVCHVLFKRFAQSCWSELCEIYGIPPRVLKTNTQDPGMLNRGERMMQDLGAAAYFIIDETESLEFAQGATTNGDVYNNLIAFCNHEISLLITGAISGQDTKHGNRSKDESAQETLWLLVQSDMKMLEEEWNNNVLPALNKIGILNKEGLTFEFMPAEDTKQLFEYTKGLLPHYKVPVEWIKDKFGVEVIEKTATDPTEEKETKEDPKGKKELFAGDRLKGFFDSAR